MAVGRFQQLGLIAAAAVIHGADGMDDEPGGEVVAARDARLAGRATTQAPALLQKPRTGCTVDGAVDTSAAEQRCVGRIHNGIDLQSGDVSFQHLHT